MSIKADGTPSFDANNNPGNDASATNGIVRVNDTVTYRIDYGVSANPGTNVSFDIALPKGVELARLPGYCGTGSSITPATAGNPTLPITGASFNQLQAQTLHCVLGNKDNVAETVDLTVKVLSYVHQGAALTITSGSIRSDESTAPVAMTTLPTVTASARLMWDLSKNGVSLTENSGAMNGATTRPCDWDTSMLCRVVGYAVTLSAPAGGKGAMPAVGDVTFTDDLSPASMYPGLTAAQLSAMNANLAKYGSRMQTAVSSTSQIPGGSIGGTNTATNSVRNSGTTTFSQPGGSGTPATVTISGADWSLRTYPSTSQGGTALPSSAAYAYSRMFFVLTPVAAVQDFGIESQGVWSINSRNVLTNLLINGFESTDVERSADQPGPNSTAYPTIQWNDYRSATLRVGGMGGFNKKFVGVPNAPGNMKAADYNPFGGIAQGPPGGATYDSGSITMAQGQNIVSMLSLGGSSPELPTPVTYLACDSWNNSLLHLRAAQYQGTASADGFATRIPSPGTTAVWISGHNNAPDPADSSKTTWGTTQAGLPSLRVQYSAFGGAGSGQASLCGDDKGPWFDDPALVPGNDPVKAAQGVYTGVNRVRVFTQLPGAVAPSVVGLTTVVYYLSIGMQVADDAPSGTIIPNWGGAYRANGAVTQAQVVTSTPQLTSTYNPGTSLTDPTGHSGIYGDRLTATAAQARLSKLVRFGTTGDFTASPPATTGGDTVQYRLAPSLTSAASAPGVLKDVWVEDCLPASQTYVEASRAPSLVSLTTPPDAHRTACAAGETYLRWVYPNAEVNQPIDPIILTVEVSPTAPTGSYNNVAVVWTDGDAATQATRSGSAQITIDGRAGIALEKLALTPLVQVNRTGSTQTEVNKWLVRLTSTLPPAQNGTITNPDIIDVLPQNGLGTTSFSGTFDFVSAAVTSGGATTRILYTNAATVAQAPSDPTNQPTGSTAWCDAPAGGNLVSGVGACPASPGDVTGLRVQRPGSLNSGDVIAIELTMVAAGDTDGDVFQNLTYAEAAGLPNPVGPIRRVERAIGGSIGDFVWRDSNGNGIQDAGEAGVPGVTVTLTGVDDLGNPINITTTTDAQGKYVFTNLRASSAAGYTVTFTPPAGMGFTQQAAGTDRATDSNAPYGVGSGVVTGVVLTSAQDRTDIDAGLVAPGINLAKTASAPANGVGFVVGEKVTYTFTATNTGDLTLSDVTLDDSDFVNGAGAGVQLDATPVVDAAASTGTAAALAPGQTLVWTGTYTVTGSDVMAGGALSNSASVTGTPPPNPTDPTRNFPPPTADDDAEVPVALADPAIELVKSADPQSGLSAGDTVTYTFTATNTGNVPLSDVALAEGAFTNAAGDDLTLTSGPTLVSVTGVADPATWDRVLPIGGVAVWTATYVLTAADVATVGPIANTATVTGTPPSANPDDPTAPPPTPVTDEDDETVFPQGVPGIQIVKTVNGQDANDAPGVQVTPGDTAVFRYLVTNVGNTVLKDVEVVDDQGVQVTFPDSFSGVLQPGESVQGIGTAPIPAGQYTNIGTVTGVPTDTQGNPILDENGDPITSVTDDDPANVFGQVPSINLVKSADPQSGLKAGDTVTYTFTITNTGNVPLSNVTLSEDAFTNAAGDRLTLTSGPTLQSATGAADPATWDRVLPTAGVAVYTATYVLTAADTATLGSIDNTASVSGTPPPVDPSTPPTPVTDEDDESVFPQGVPGVAIVKSVNGEDANTAPGVVVNAGDTATFTYVVTNVGNTVLTDVQVVDDKGVVVTFPADFDGTLQVGQSVTGTGTGVVPAGQYTNIGTVTGVPVDGDGNPILDENGDPITSVTDDDPANAFGQDPSIDLIKSADPQSGLAAGDTVTYTFTATNTGNVPLTSVELKEDSFTNAAGDQLSLTSGPTLQSVTGVDDPASWNQVLQPGDVAVWTGTYTVTAADVATVGSIDNTASVSGTPPPVDDPNAPPPTPVTDTDEENVFPQGSPGISIVKSVNGEDANTAPGVQVTAGDTATFSYVVTNVGNTVLTDVSVVDDKGVQVTFPDTFSGTLQVGESVTGTGTGVVPAGQYTNIGTVTGTPVDGDGNPILDENGDPITSVTDDDPANAFGQDPSLSVSKTVDRATALVGDTLTYQVVVTNDGNVDLAGVVATDTLPDGLTFRSVTGGGTHVDGVITWQVGDLAVGESVTFTVTGIVASGAERTTLTNKVGVTGTNPNPPGGVPPGEQPPTVPGVPTPGTVCADDPTQACASTTVEEPPVVASSSVNPPAPTTGGPTTGGPGTGGPGTGGPGTTAPSGTATNGSVPPASQTAGTPVPTTVLSGSVNPGPGAGSINSGNGTLSQGNNVALLVGGLLLLLLAAAGAMVLIKRRQAQHH